MILKSLITPNEHPHINMAIDWYILENAVPTLHTFTWNPPAVSIGYLQKSSALNWKEIKRRQFLVARRPTGGKAVIHVGDISLALFIPSNILPKRAKEAYFVLSNVLQEALENITGISLSRTNEDEYHRHEGCFTSSTGYEIGIKGEKVAGIAVRKIKAGMLMHASIRIEPFPVFAGDLITPPEKMKGTSFKEHGITFSPYDLHESMLDTLGKHLNIQREEIYIDKAAVSDYLPKVIVEPI